MTSRPEPPLLVSSLLRAPARRSEPDLVRRTRASPVRRVGGLV